MVGKFAFRLVALLVLAWSKASNEENLDLLKSPSLGESGRRLVIQVDPDLRKIVEDDLDSSKMNLNEKLYYKIYQNVDCSGIAFEDEERSVYIGTTDDINGISLVECSDAGHLKGMILVHGYLDEFIKKSRGSVFRSLLIKLTVLNFTRDEVEINEVNLCRGGYFDLNEFRCTRRIKKYELSLEEKFNILKALGHPYAINSLALEPSLTYDFFTFLVNELYNYVYAFDESISYTITEF